VAAENRVVLNYCVVGARHIQAAATSGDGLREIDTLIGLEWDYSEYDGIEAE
jgi:hypothetical protein